MFQRKTALTVLTVFLFAITAIVGGLVAGSSTNAALAGPSQQGSSPRSITVTGYGTASGAPDIAFMSLGVESSAPDIGAALADNNSRMEAVIAVLNENGVAREDVRTDYFNIYQDKGFQPFPTDSSSPSSESQTMYRVNNSVVVTVRDVTKVGELLSAVVEAGANTINWVNFSIADRAALEADARIAALADARDRAQQLADELGVQLGEVLEVVEYSGGFVGPMEAAAGGGGGGVPPISQGSLTVSLSLNVKFAIQ
jgi:uncharacterized protein YggE